MDKKPLLTKKQRKAFYKKMLEVLRDKESYDACYCWIIEDIDISFDPRRGMTLTYKKEYRDGEFINPYSENDFARELPELYTFHPGHGRMFWWPTDEEGKEKRISILEEIIENL